MTLIYIIISDIYIYIAITASISTIILFVGFGVISIIPYPAIELDLIINCVCIGLTFNNFDAQYKFCCKICIGCRCCGGKNQVSVGNESEMKEITV